MRKLFIVSAISSITIALSLYTFFTLHPTAMFDVLYVTSKDRLWGPQQATARSLDMLTPNIPSTDRPAERNAYVAGYQDSLRTYAHWKDGVQYVGSTGKSLKAASDEIDSLRVKPADPIDIPAKALASEIEYALKQLEHYATPCKSGTGEERDHYQQMIGRLSLRVRQLRASRE